MSGLSGRRTFVKQASLVVAGACASPWLQHALAGADDVVVSTECGRVRGTVVDAINIFKGIPYGATTAGKNRFMPPVKPTPWTATRDALAYGPTAPQALGRTRRNAPAEGEDCLGHDGHPPWTSKGRPRPA